MQGVHIFTKGILRAYLTYMYTDNTLDTFNDRMPRATLVPGTHFSRFGYCGLCGVVGSALIGGLGLGLSDRISPQSPCKVSSRSLACY